MTTEQDAYERGFVAGWRARGDELTKPSTTRPWEAMPAAPPTKSYAPPLSFLYHCGQCEKQSAVPIMFCGKLNCPAAAFGHKVGC